jgi:hypothetical protein
MRDFFFAPLLARDRIQDVELLSKNSNERLITRRTVQLANLEQSSAGKTTRPDNQNVLSPRKNAKTNKHKQASLSRKGENVRKSRISGVARRVNYVSRLIITLVGLLQLI